MNRASEACRKCEDEAKIKKECSVLPCGRYLKTYIASQNGVAKAIETWQMMIPLHDNEGKQYHKDVINNIREVVIKQFGGDTETTAVGRWKQDQRIYVDRNLRVEIDAHANDHDNAESYMVTMKEAIRLILQQERIYVTYSFSRFELLTQDEFFKEIGYKPTSNISEPMSQ